MIIYAPHKILFEIGFLKFPSYGFMLAIALLSGFAFAYFRQKDEKKRDHVLASFVLAILGTIFGSRGLFVLLNIGYFITNPGEIIAAWDGGLVFYGGFLLSLLLMFIYFKINKLNTLEYLEMFLPSVALGLAITRIGCFLNWCCYGIQSSLPWAIKVGSDVARHPTQIYSSIFDFALFLFLWRFGKKKHTQGLIAALFFILYGIFRFLIDFIRYYDNVYYFGFLTAFQIISLVFIVTGVFILLKKKSSLF
jgi:phosphatidylglycerol:prolipoprotein diacylglycerol transferase